MSLQCISISMQKESYTMKLLVVVFVFIYAGLSECVDNCPPVPCPAIMYPASCRVSVFTEVGGERCPLCDQCIDKTGPKDDNGCPLRACTLMAIPAECQSRAYYYFEGKLCEDCPHNTCTM